MEITVKTLGIVGGIAPWSTIEYYRQFIAGYRARQRDDSYPHFIINSINLRTMLSLAAANRLEELTGFLVQELQRLARAGADIGLFASNTPHMVFDALRRLSPMPLISIVDATRDAAAAAGLKRVGLIGTGYTMRGGFYAATFADGGIEVVVPNGSEQAFIHERYMNEFVDGRFPAETKARFVEIVELLKRRDGIDGLILGGTELPLLLSESDGLGIPLLDTTKLHVDRAVTEVMS
jgi:aspartate racemase